MPYLQNKLRSALSAVMLHGNYLYRSVIWYMLQENIINYSYAHHIIRTIRQEYVKLQSKTVLRGYVYELNDRQFQS